MQVGPEYCDVKAQGPGVCGRQFGGARASVTCPTQSPKPISAPARSLVSPPREKFLQTYTRPSAASGTSGAPCEPSPVPQQPSAALTSGPMFSKRTANGWRCFLMPAGKTTRPRIGLMESAT